MQGRRTKSQDKLPNILWLQVMPIDDAGDIPLLPTEKKHQQLLDMPIFLHDARHHAPEAGDQIFARLKPSEEAYYATILHHRKNQSQSMIGMVEQTEQGFLFHPAHKKQKKIFNIPARSIKQFALVDGDLVKLTLDGEVTASARDKHRRTAPQDLDVAISHVEKIGTHNATYALNHLSIAEYDIRTDFSDDALVQTDNLTAITQCEAGRIDLTHLPFVTIDGADAKDFDDAVYAEMVERDLQLYVAIADVAFYVPMQSALDDEARKRGNSVYLPNMVVPMLPEKLSNDLCSLRQDEKRPVMIAKIHILPDGQLGDYHLFPAMIQSHARLTYQQAETLLADDADNTTAEAPLSYLPSLQKLQHIYQLLREERDVRGAIDLDRIEYKIMFDEENIPYNIAPAKRLQSHQLIEEIMIAANRVVAHYLLHAPQCQQGVFRIHERPSPEKAEELRLAAVEFGLKMPHKMGAHSKDYQHLLQRAKGEDYYEMLTDACLKAQMQACYQTSNHGHFGLALAHYSHFTSPIRRYADLMLHQLLKYLLQLDAGTHQQPDVSTQICTHISATERVAQKCEYACFDRYAALLLEKYENQQLIGTISYIGKGGLFVRLDAIGAEGFLPARLLNLPRSSHQQYGRKYGSARNQGGNQGGYQGRNNLEELFSPYDKITVTILERNILTGQIALAPVAPAHEGAKKSKQAANKQPNKQAKHEASAVDDATQPHVSKKVKAKKATAKKQTDKKLAKRLARKATRKKARLKARKAKAKDSDMAT